MESTNQIISESKLIKKSPTGIEGFDGVVDGGLPQGRTTLVCGGPGSGKTLFAAEFLVRGAQEYGEPGVFMAFEETPEELAKNVASLGMDLEELVQQKKIFIDYVHIVRNEIEETGEYDLEGLFIRLASAIEIIGARRVVLDTIETIFAGFANEQILRSEIRRLFRWMQDKGMTSVVTGERGEKSLTRYGLEEYISDCVILLDNRVQNKIANRILRVVKYRGSSHGTDEYPFLIGDKGIWVQPVTSLGLNYEVPNDWISSGVSGLDEMLDGKGFYRGSSILVSGTAGTGKSSLAASLVHSTCQSGERCLYFSFEESTHQILRNMRSISIDLNPWLEKGLLKFNAARPTFYGLEMHLLRMEKLVQEFEPSVVVIDPLTNLITIGSEMEVKSMLVRLIDYLKMKQITTLFTGLTHEGDKMFQSVLGISSLMDTWIQVHNLEHNGERNRGLYVLKARGMRHSTQIREFILTHEGLELVDVYQGPDGILTGSARSAQKALDKSEEIHRHAEAEKRQQEYSYRRTILESQMAALQAEMEAEGTHFHKMEAEEDEQHKQASEERKSMEKIRQGGNRSSVAGDEQ